jgi:hypothetical protein
MDPQLLKERLAVIPQELKNYIASDELDRRIELLGKKYKLTDEQLTVLQNEVSFILLLIESTDNLILNLEKEMGLPLETADNVAKDVMEYVLNRVDPYLIHNKEDLVVVDDDTSTFHSEKEVGQINDTSYQDIEKINTGFQPEKTAGMTNAEDKNTEDMDSRLIAAGMTKGNKTNTYQPNPSKSAILEHIENPPKTVIKKYVIEYDHPPLQDTSHLIDDKTKNTLKLQEHYLD